MSSSPTTAPSASHSVATQATAIHSTAKQDIWREAIDSLGPEFVKRLAASTKTTSTAYTINTVQLLRNDVLVLAGSKRDKTIKKRWRVAMPGGQKVIVRDVMEKIIHWLNRFKEVGDNAVQHDPGHAALPWVAIRFVLQAMVNYSEFEGQVMEDLELISQLLARYGMIELEYAGLTSPLELRDALVDGYVCTLTSLAEIVEFFSESKMTKLPKSPFRTSRGETRAKLLAKEVQVLRFTALVDGRRLHEIATRTTDLAQCTERDVEQQKYVAILNWLSKTDYIKHHADFGQMRTPGTGSWLLRHPEYTAWLQSSVSSTLLLHGISGCGKTILSCAVIDDCLQSHSITTTKAPLAYFYCSAACSEPDRGKTIGILKSQVRQLTVAVSRYPKIHDKVLTAYDAKAEEAKRQGFDLRDLCNSDCVTLILAALESNPATIVIDAIDELGDLEQLLTCLETVCATANNVFKILITSKDQTPAIQMPPAAHKLRITPTENHNDVEKFVVAEVEKLKFSQEMKDKIVESLVTEAGEMFQWAKLQLSRLKAIRRTLLEEDFLEEWDRLKAATIDELYKEVFEKLFESGPVAREVVQHSFCRLLCAQEPLSIDAFSEAIATTSSWKTPDPERVVELCDGVLYMDTQSKVFRFVHQSVQEFLQAQLPFFPHEAQTVMSLDCLRILENPPVDDLTELNPIHGIYDYATLHLGYHLSSMDVNRIPHTVKSDIEDFLFRDDGTGPHAMIWLQTVKSTFKYLPYAHPRKLEMEVVMSDACVPQFPICAFGLVHVSRRRTWVQSFGWDQRNAHGHTALYVASYFGHNQVISFLLDQKADPNIECGSLGSALQRAAYRRHKNACRH